jgi:hypothetical protein
VKNIILECSCIGQLISIQVALYPHSVLIFSLIPMLLGPLLPFPVDDPILELAELALGLCDDGSSSMRKVIFKESEVVKSFTIEFPISFLFGINDFPPIV